jgi:hypothetical protein
LTQKIDKNFYDTLKILNSSKNIYYCCTQGTMLGLLRDGDLLPWDTDIDIIISTNKIGYEELINLMKSNGFKGGFNRKFRPGLPVMKFYRSGGRVVEFITYLKNSKDEYCLEWFECEIPQIYENLKLYQKFIYKFLKIIGRTPYQEVQVGLKPCLYVENKFKRVLCCALKNFFLSINSINIWLRKLVNLDSLIGYYSKNLNPLKTRIINYYGVDCLIPEESEKVCDDFFGSDWHIAKKSSHYTEYLKKNS